MSIGVVRRVQKVMLLMSWRRRASGESSCGSPRSSAASTNFASAACEPLITSPPGARAALRMSFPSS